jgi:mono/diheme cytochrome c family protein
MNLNGRTGRIPKSVTVRTLQGFKVLTVVAEVMPPSTNAEIAERERNQVLAKTDRQMVFKGDCATCHAERAKGKFGQELYVATCGICHDAKPRASMVPNLRALNHPTGHDFWKMMITNGKPGTLMPAFASDQGGPLTELQIESLTVFVDENIRAVAQLDGANGGGTNTVTPAKN